MHICMLSFCKLFLRLHYLTERSKAKFYMQAVWCRNMLITPPDHVYLLKQKDLYMLYPNYYFSLFTHLFSENKKELFSFLNSENSLLFSYCSWEMNWHFSRTIYHNPKISVLSANRHCRAHPSVLKLRQHVSICTAYVCPY